MVYLLIKTQGSLRSRVVFFMVAVPTQLWAVVLIYKVVAAVIQPDC